MIIARNDTPFKCYMTVWSLTAAEKYTDARTSTSEKSQSTGEYINSNWFVRFLGKAHEKAQTLGVKDRIIVNSMKLTNETYTAKDGSKKSALKILIFDFDVQNKDGETNAPAKPASNATTKKTAAKKEAEATEYSEDLPF